MSLPGPSRTITVEPVEVPVPDQPPEPLPTEPAEPPPEKEEPVPTP